MRLLAWALLGAPALLPGTQAHAQAPESAGGVRAGLSAAEVMAIAERAEAAGDRAAAKAAYVALAADPDVDVRSEARFRHGRLLAAEKDYAGAATLYRRILDERPDAGRVRLELGAVLALMGDTGAARRELRQAQAGGLPPEVTLAVRQFAGALRAYKPYGGSITVALAPDSNINRATDSETLDTVIAPLNLSGDAQAQSGVGLRIGGQGYFQLPLADGLTVQARLSGQAELYRASRFNDISASVAVGLEWIAGRNRLRPAAAQTMRFYGGDLYARTRSASLNWLRPLGTEAQIDATVTVGRADYRLNDLQDGWLYDVAAAYERALDARSGGSVGASFSRQTARDPGYATTAGGANLLYWREAGRITLFGTLGLRRLEADARLLLFPERRREWLYSLGAGATFRQLAVNGFAPLVRLSLERNASTVGLYDYRRTAVDFGITRAF
jgi:outer membrane protein